MKFPKFLQEKGTIAFVAPSFGCAIEPYKSGFEKKQLFKFDKTASSDVTIKVIALGGITPERLPALSDMDFDGFAALGALTGASDLEEFRKNLRSFTQTLNNI